jgi:phage repressor protein C with HTH and peptisase S24 domain
VNFDFHREQLAKGTSVSFRPKGNSMQPKIKSGQLVTISPEISNIAEGDIVFCKVHGHFYVHLVSAIKKEQDKTLYQISNNKGRINGWIGTNSLYGKVVKIDD